MSGNKDFMPFPCFCVLGKLHSVLMGLLWCDMLVLVVITVEMSRTVFIEQDLTAYMGFGIRQQLLVSGEQDQELFHSPVRICR